MAAVADSFVVVAVVGLVVVVLVVETVVMATIAHHYFDFVCPAEMNFVERECVLLQTLRS